jgi:hypothetical protein
MYVNWCNLLFNCYWLVLCHSVTHVDKKINEMKWNEMNLRLLKWLAAESSNYKIFDCIQSNARNSTSVQCCFEIWMPLYLDFCTLTCESWDVMMMVKYMIYKTYLMWGLCCLINRFVVNCTVYTTMILNT